MFMNKPQAEHGNHGQYIALQNDSSCRSFLDCDNMHPRGPRDDDLAFQKRNRDRKRSALRSVRKEHAADDSKSSRHDQRILRRHVSAMTKEEVSPFLGKCVAVYLESGEIFQGLLRSSDAVYEVDAGSSQMSIDTPEAINHIELLKT
jgi:hypothetical protein